MSIEIRQATAADAAAIHAITQEAFKKYAEDLALPGAVTALTETPADILRQLQEKVILIAFLDGEPVGSIRYERLGDVAYISRFGVKLAAQKACVGRALMEDVEARARGEGYAAIALHTSSRMTPLMRFYYGRGYFVQSLTYDRGYIRALLVRELGAQDAYDLTGAMKK